MRSLNFVRRIAIVTGMAVLATCSLSAFAAEGSFDRTLHVSWRL